MVSNGKNSCLSSSSLANETSVSNNTQCAPVDQKYVESNSIFFLMGASLAGIGVVITVIVFIYINRYNLEFVIWSIYDLVWSEMVNSKTISLSKSNHPLMKASDVTFSNIYLLALIIGFIVGVCSILK